MTALEILAEDLRFAFASIRRNPVMALAIVLTLTLGIGLNVGVFTVLNALLFRPRIEKDPATFAHLAPVYSGAARRGEIQGTVSLKDYRTFASESRSLGQLAAWATRNVSLGRGSSDSGLALLVTANFFDVYGLDHMKLGRVFYAEECSTPGSAAVAVIGEELWRNRFASDPAIVGKTVKLNRVPFTIVGVAPAGFSGRVRGFGVWIPWTMEPVLFPRQDFFRDETFRWLFSEGRLAHGHSREEARAELQVMASRADQLQPPRQTTMILTNGSVAEDPALRKNLFWLSPLVMTGLTLILLMTCTNVAILQLSRAVRRQREMAIRLAIGGGRWRLAGMLLTETLVLAAIAGAVCVPVAYRAPTVFMSMLGSANTPVYPLQPDLTVMIYLGLAVLMSACFAGLSPAAESLRVNLAASMKAGETLSGSGTKSRNSYLVAIQVASCVVLLGAVALFIRAQYRMYTADPGFETRSVLLVATQSVADRATTPALLGRLHSLSSVLSVAAGTPFPGGDFGGDLTGVRVPHAGSEDRKTAVTSLVSPEFFETLSIPLSRGRLFGADREVVVSEALARAFWPDEDPLGRRLILEDGTEVNVTGVARDLSVEQAGSPDSPHIYRPRDPRAPADTILIRFAGPPETVEASVRDVLKQLDAESTVVPRTLRSILDQNAENLTLLVRMVAVFAGVAVGLAVLGIYGVVALGVSRRTREIGIRVAVGATRARIAGTVLSSSLSPVAIGLAIGLVLAGVAARATGVLFQRTPLPIRAADPWLYFSVACVLAIVAVAAMIPPALRAAALDPMKALRDE